MDVRGSHRMSVNRSQELIRWAVRGKRICGWSEAVETVLAILVCLVLSSKIVVALVIWILEVIFAVAACLPQIECNVGDWLLCCKISDSAMHVSDQSFVLVLDNAVAQFSPRGVRRPERTKDGSGRGNVVRIVGLDKVGDFSDKSEFC